jgi:hypothetical protein
VNFIHSLTSRPSSNSFSFCVTSAEACSAPVSSVTVTQHYGSLISNEDMLYVLAIFATMGSLFCNSRWFSVRSFSKAENEIAFLHWMHIGRLMGIQAEGANWKCFRDVLHFKNDYEVKYRKFSATNFTVASKTLRAKQYSSSLERFQLGLDFSSSPYHFMSCRRCKGKGRAVQLLAFQNQTEP